MYIKRADTLRTFPHFPSYIQYQNNKIHGKSDIGVIGLAVMGKRLALNLESKGYSVSVYNRPHPDCSVTSRFLEKYGEGQNFRGFEDIKEFVNSLGRPRKILIMMKTGTARMLARILRPGPDSENIPTDYIARHADPIGFFTDEAAAGKIRTQKNICKTDK